MKKTGLFLSMLLMSVVVSCSTSSLLVGELNMISTRNVETLKTPVLLSRFSGDSKEYVKRALKDKNYTGQTIHDAVNYAVKSVPGGEFLMNCKIYVIYSKNAAKYFATGDVYGYENQVQHQGFAVGDAVVFKRTGKYVNGKVVALKNTDVCIVELEDGSKVDVKYSDLSKANSNQ